MPNRMATSRTCRISPDVNAPAVVEGMIDQCLKASHLFNLLDARGVISVSERAAYIARVRNLAKLCCETWLAGEDK